MSKRLGPAVWAAAGLVLFGGGCNPASLSYFLFKGDGKAPAAYPFEPKGEKKEVTVAVLVSVPGGGLDADFAALDREFIAALARAFVDQSKDSKKPAVKVLEAGKLDRFRAAHPGWKTMKAADIGKELGADYVIDVAVNTVRLYDPGSGRLMYEGRADLEAVAWDCETGSEHSRYALNVRLDTQFAESVPKSQYRSKLVQRMALEVSWKHIPHITEQRVPAPSL